MCIYVSEFRIRTKSHSQPNNKNYSSTTNQHHHNSTSKQVSIDSDHSPAPYPIQQQPVPQYGGHHHNQQPIHHQFGDQRQDMNHLPPSGSSRHLLNPSSVFSPYNNFATSAGVVGSLRENTTRSPSPAAIAAAHAASEDTNSLQRIVTHLERENNNLQTHVETFKSTENLLKSRIQELEALFNARGGGGNTNTNSGGSTSQLNSTDYSKLPDSEAAFLKHKVNFQEQELQSVKKHLNSSRDAERKTDAKYKESMFRFEQLQTHLHEIQMKHSRQTLELKSVMEQNEIMRRENRRLVDSEGTLRKKLMELTAEKDIAKINNHRGNNNSNDRVEMSANSSEEEGMSKSRGSGKKSTTSTNRRRHYHQHHQKNISKNYEYDISETEVQVEVRIGLYKLVDDEIRKASDAKAKASLLSGVSISSSISTHQSPHLTASIVPNHHLDIILTTLHSLRPLLQSPISSTHSSIIQSLVHGAIGCSNVFLSLIDESRAIETRIHHIGQESSKLKEETERTLMHITTKYEDELARLREEKHRLESEADHYKHELRSHKLDFEDAVKKSNEALSSAFNDLKSEHMAAIKEQHHPLHQQPHQHEYPKHQYTSSVPSSPQLKQHTEQYENQLLYLNRELASLSAAHARLKSQNESQERTIEAWKKENRHLREALEVLQRQKAEEEKTGGPNAVEIEGYKDSIEKLDAQLEDEKLRNKKAAELIKVLKEEVTSSAGEAEKLRKALSASTSITRSQSSEFIGSSDAETSASVLPQSVRAQSENEQLRKLRVIIKEKMEQMKSRAKRSPSPHSHHHVSPSHNGDPFGVGEMETLLHLLKDNQETVNRLNELQSMVDGRNKTWLKIFMSILKPSNFYHLEQTDLMASLQHEKLTLTGSNESMIQQLLEYKEKSKIREQAWLTKLKALQKEMSLSKTVYEECEKILDTYEKMWTECKITSVKAGFDIKQLEEDSVVGTQSSSPTKKNLPVETAEVVKAVTKDHPFAFIDLHTLVTNQFMSTSHSLTHVRHQLEDASKQAENRLEQLENVVENLRVKSDSEAIVRNELDKWKTKYEQMEKNTEIISSEKKIVEAKLKRIVGGFKTMVGLEDGMDSPIFQPTRNSPTRTSAM